jgi:hypothetical protein
MVSGPTQEEWMQSQILNFASIGSSETSKALQKQISFAKKQLGSTLLGSEASTESIARLAESFTRGKGNRAVIGRWSGGVGDYIDNAKTKGGIWFETDEDFFASIGFDEEKAWAVNEQFF